jgi:hypothetical protein
MIIRNPLYYFGMPIDYSKKLGMLTLSGEPFPPFSASLQYFDSPPATHVSISLNLFIPTNRIAPPLTTSNE